MDSTTTQLKFLYVQLALVLAIGACATTNLPYASSGAAPHLAGTRWTVTRIDGGAPLRDATLHTDFGVDGRVNGDSGCNSFSAPYVQDGSMVRIGGLLSSRRACADSDRQRQENHMRAILQGANSAKLDHGYLSLRSSDGTLLMSRG